MENELQERMIKYAEDALYKRDRADVFDAIISLLQNWSSYDGIEGVEEAFQKIQKESVRSVKFPVRDVHAVEEEDDRVQDAYKRERKGPLPSFAEAYVKEFK